MNIIDKILSRFNNNILIRNELFKKKEFNDKKNSILDKNFNPFFKKNKVKDGESQSWIIYILLLSWESSVCKKFLLMQISSFLTKIKKKLPINNNSD